MTTQSRSIKELIVPQVVIEGAGVRLLRSFGPSQKNGFDPLLLFDHFAFNDPVEGPLSGFPTHPHRGIETVTYMLEGSVRHRDSLGNVGVIGPGGMQWMTSGRGIMHEEMPRRSENDHVFGFQLWVNMPAADKMGEPGYQEVQAEGIPVVDQPGVSVRVVAGEYEGVNGVISRNVADALYYDVKLTDDKEIHLPVPAGHTLLTYVFEGDGRFGEEQQLVSGPRMLMYEDGDSLHVTAGSYGCRFILIAGRPFGEPIFPHGPFVMNTREEIQQALADLRNGTFVK